MIKIYNDKILVTKDDPAYFPLLINFKYHEPERKLRIPNKNRVYTMPEQEYLLYEIIDNRYMEIPYGYAYFVKDYISQSKVIDMRRPNSIGKIDVNNYKDILPNIELYEDQLLALDKIFKHKRCIVQLSTGAGKTEIMCALIAILYEISGIYPTTLLLEPTIKLVNDTNKRFSKYNVPSVIYNDNREIISNTVNISHPKSLLNDLSSNITHLDSVNILMVDECHHTSNNTMQTVINSLNNLDYKVGVSASAVDQDHIFSRDFREYSYNELLTIKTLGNVVMNASAGDLVEKDRLSESVLLVMYNPAMEDLPEEDIANWHKVRELRLESPQRIDLVAQSANFFHMKGRKTLILVSTISWAQKILKQLDFYGLSDYSRASYGGGRFEKYVDNQFVEDKTDVFKLYDEGIYDIVIGTSHIYEGADINKLDTIILAYGGRAERLQIQGLGRVLRKSKTGRYAYIVDFTDSNDVVLSKHSEIRMERYRDIINIPNERVFYSILPRDLNNIFNEMEEL